MAIKNIIVSTKDFSSFEQFACFKTMKDALAFVSKLGDNGAGISLVFHSSTDSAENTCINITNLYKQTSGMVRFFYISAVPESMISLCIAGVGGLVLQDEFYLDDEDGLLYAITLQPMVTVQTNTDIIMDFIQSYSRGDVKVNSPAYVEQARNAVDSLINELTVSNNALTELGAGALQTFQKISNYCETVRTLQSQLQEQLSRLEEYKGVAPVIQPALTNNAMKFQQFNYIKKTNIVYFREYRKAPFVTSLALDYKKWIVAQHKKTCTLLFLCSQDVTEWQKYSAIDGCAKIDMTNKGMNKLFESEIVATNCPTNEIITKVLSQDKQVFIVVDRVHQDTSIFKGQFKSLNIYATESDMKLDKKKPSESIFTLSSVDGAVLNVPLFQPKTMTQKHIQILMAYQKMCFPSLDKYFAGQI